MSWLEALSEPRPASQAAPGGKEANPQSVARARHEGRAGDDFNERADWADILLPVGAVLHHEAGGVRYWTRPGKDLRDGHSATTGWADDADRLKLFTSHWPPFTDGDVYTKFAAFAMLNHGGDYQAAARELSRVGYGSQRPAQAATVAADSDRARPSSCPEENAAVQPNPPAGEAVTPGAIAIRELRSIPADQDQAARFLAASVIVASAVLKRPPAAELMALRREAKTLSLLNFGEFDEIAAEARQQLGADDSDGAEVRGPSQATRLVNLAVGMYDFGVTQSGDAFAVPREGGRVVRMLRGGRPALRPELASAMFAAEGNAPNGSALSDAVAVIEGLAQQRDPTELSLRTARHGGSLLLDLGDVTGRVVEITPDGWDVIDRSPILFRRTAATLPLPEPVGGSSLDDTMFALLNVSKADRPLMKAVLVHYLWPDIGHVITRLTGRDGTAKTWATRIMRSLIDPSAAPTRAMPKDETDWIIAVNAALIAAIDNVSAIPDWLSDAMCRAATGEGLMRRKLYTDQDVSILSARRVVILNGIDATIRNADFARRTADFELQQITKIKSDSEVEAEWAKLHPRALGALLDTAVVTLQRLGGTTLAGAEQSLTMGDFARIAKSVDEPVLKIYMSRLGTAAADVVEANPFARALIKFMEDQPDGRWTGLAGELVTDAIRRPDPMPKGWPQDPTRFAVWVKRYGRVLETAAGIRITKCDRIAQGQPYTLERIPQDTPVREIGNSATSDAQLQPDSPTSDDAALSDVANGILQLHGSGSGDQRGCSREADVANSPALKDRREKNICRVCGGRLNPKLAEAGDTTHPNCEANPDGGKAA